MHTVHHYVKSLYKVYGIASRPELLAVFIRQKPLRPGQFYRDGKP
jgi:DNA-binding CsgD family transcriptional regulator